MSAAFRMVEPGSALDMDPDLLAIPTVAVFASSSAAALLRHLSLPSSSTRTYAVLRNDFSAYIAQASSSEPHCRGERPATPISRIASANSVTNAWAPDALHRRRLTCATRSIPSPRSVH